MCFAPLNPTPVRSTPAEVVQKVGFERHFRELGVNGSIVIYHLNRDRTFQHNPSRNATAFLPASTFKILNSLIALETGVVAGPSALLTWDGIQRSVPEWNQDLTMQEAFKRSAVWYYQVLARRIGHDRMQKWVAQTKYGNQTIGSEAEIDKFWLEGALRITPQEQIQFLRRFYQNDLPFSARSMAIVKNLMVLEQTPAYTLRGKTGWVGFADEGKAEIGWLVGYVEKGKDVYLFATNIDIQKPQDAAARLELTRRCFKDLGVI